MKAIEGKWKWANNEYAGDFLDNGFNIEFIGKTSFRSSDDFGYTLKSGIYHETDGTIRFCNAYGNDYRIYKTDGGFLQWQESGYKGELWYLMGSNRQILARGVMLDSFTKLVTLVHALPSSLQYISNFFG